MNRLIPLLVACLLLGSFAPAQLDGREISKLPAEGAVEGPEFTQPIECSNILWSARLLDPEVFVGEPVVVEIRMSGTLGTPKLPAEYNTRFRFGRGFRLYVQPKQRSLGPSYEYTLPGPSFKQGSAVQLQKHEEREVQMIMAYDPNSPSGAAFSQAGEYELVFTMMCRDYDPEQDRNVTTEILLGSFDLTVRMPDVDDPSLPFLHGLARDYETFASFQNLQARPEDIPILTDIVNAPREVVYRPWALGGGRAPDAEE